VESARERAREREIETCDTVSREGDSPPCGQKSRLSIVAASGRKSKRSVKHFHTFALHICIIYIYTSVAIIYISYGDNLYIYMLYVHTRN